MKAAVLPSPCINVCQMHEATGWCSGCMRTLDEIAVWGGLAEADKQVVWKQLRQRRVLWRQLRQQAAGGADTVMAAPVAPVSPSKPPTDTGA